MEKIFCAVGTKFGYATISIFKNAPRMRFFVIMENVFRH
uniref:Uncharacterized protein n=1 Tax=Romanomermis culicivorax TaxID=13658 RepID=A0A915KN04_ROMCU